MLKPDESTAKSVSTVCNGKLPNQATKWLEDRNGNRITFYSEGGTPTLVTRIVDSVGRTVNIDHGANEAPFGTHIKITYKGYSGESRIIRVGETQIWLPDERTYNLTFNSNNELSRVDLPTGGAYEYEWGGELPYQTYQCQPLNGPVAYRYVTERRVFADGVHPSSKMTFSAPNGVTQVDNYLVDNAGVYRLLSRSKHFFHGDPVPQVPSENPHWTYASAEYGSVLNGKEYRTESYAPSDALLRVQESTWVTGRQIVWSIAPETQSININPRVAANQTTLTDVSPNLVSKTEYLFNQGQWAGTFFNVLTDTMQYDYGLGTPGTFKSRIHSEYISYDSGNYQTQPYIPLLPSETWVSSDFYGNNKASLTRYEYDNYTPDSTHAPLIDRPNIVSHNSARGTTYTQRGNPTKVTSYANAQAQTGEVSAYSQYDIAGNVVKAIDARGYATTVDFRDNFGAPVDTVESGGQPLNTPPTELSTATAFAFPFAVTNALGHKVFNKFDYYLGTAVAGEDPNGTVSRSYFIDLLDRPTKVIRADNNTAAKNQTTFIYDDAARTVTTKNDKNNFEDGLLKMELVYDGLGRTTETRQYENATDYIAVRRVPSEGWQDGGNWFATSKSSNPFRPYLNGQSHEQPVWTRSFSDALGRVVKVETPDNAVVTTSYSGNTVTVSDQVGKARKSVTDAFGRLKEVYENPAGVNYLTSYDYDVLGNLTTVNQGGQTRLFAYDSLKRLTSVSNPESGPISYQYDNNGNLTQKTDPRLLGDNLTHVTITYAYDALNRNTSVTYSDGTPSVYRYYDGSVNGKGRLTWVDTSDVSGAVFDIYDALGRPVQYRQRFRVNGAWGDNFTVTANYDKSGQVISETYPSGRTVNYSYDGAGRLNNFTGNLGDGTQRTYSSGISYSSFGGLTQEQFGMTTPIYNKRHYNVRGQLYDVRASTFSLAANEFDWNRGCLAFYYGGAAWGQSSNTNNGNVTMQQHWVPGDDNYNNYWYTQNHYAYDALNRLSSVSELHGGPWGQSAQDYAQAYIYDRYGNRSIDQNNTSPTVNRTQFDMSEAASSNRLYAPGDISLPVDQRQMRYDAAGNLYYDVYTGQGTRTFDAENRMTRAWANGPSYTYNGDGQRIKRNVAGTETWQIYGLGGELLAEYAQNAPATSPQKEYGYRNGELLVTADAPPPGSGDTNGYSFRRTLTVDHTKVPNTDQSNFPVLVSGTYSYLAVTGNGGQVQNANGYDVIFTSDAGCSNKLDHEVESYNAVTGAVNYWVKVPTVSHTADTVIYMCYGKAGVTTDQSNRNGVWDSNYKGVWHLNDNAASTTVADSTSNVTNGASSASTNTRTVAAQTANGLTFDGSNDKVTIGNGVVDANGDFTISAWAYIADTSHNAYSIMGGTVPGSIWGYFILIHRADKGGLTFQYDVNGNGALFTTPSANMTATTWTHVVLVRDHTNGRVKIYQNGVQITDAPINPSFNNSTSQGWAFGSWAATWAANNWNGRLDEVRLSRTARSADWARTEYNNQSSPASFYAISGASSGSSSQNVAWTNSVGVAANGNNLTDTAPLGWGNSGAVSTQAIASGDGYVEFTVNETNTLRMCGLSHGDADQNYTDIDYAFYPWQDGVLYIFESGNYRGTFGTYASGDRLQVAVEGGVVKYRKNGALVYTSTATPSYPLLVDTSLYSNGATLTNVVISGAGGGVSSSSIHWMVTDRLGTPRIILDQTGSLANISRHDYLPFGEEVPSNFRTGIPGYTPGDSVRQKFTGYERDTETSLDFAEARYFASSAGRFTSVDPLGASANIGNPQTFNRYAYALNSPQKYTDPSGMSPCGNGNPNGANAGRECTQADDLTQEEFNGALARYTFNRRSQGYLDDTGDHTVSMYSVSIQQQDTRPLITDMVQPNDGVGILPNGNYRFQVNANLTLGHDGDHVLGARTGSSVKAIAGLTGLVLNWYPQGGGAFSVYILLRDQKTVMVLKDLENLSRQVRQAPTGMNFLNKNGKPINGVMLNAGDRIGSTSRWSGARNDAHVGMHFGFVHFEFIRQFRGNIRNNVGSPPSYLINPCGSSSPVRCK